MPAFQRLCDTYRGDFLLVGVDVGPLIGLGSRQGTEDLLEELGQAYPAAYAVDAHAMLDYGVLGVPTTVFYEGDGNEISRQSGLLTGRC